jgi:hypothetical protein
MALPARTLLRQLMNSISPMTSNRLYGASLGIGRLPFERAAGACLTYDCSPPLPAVGQLGFLMRIASVFSFVVLSAATLPAQAQNLPEHTVLAFNLPSCPKGWVEYAPAAGALVVGVGDSFQLGRGGVGSTNVTISDAGGNSAPKATKVAGLLFCERNINRR